MGTINFNTGKSAEDLFITAAVILKIVAACDTDAKACAALETLRHLNTSPASVHVSNCTFDTRDK
jgi:hypothetical protein